MVAAPRFYPKHNKDTPINHIDSMLHMAEAAGCQLMPQATQPSRLRGLCPFHETQRLHTANTLVVNLLTGNFYCQHCKVNGTPAAFVALVWGVCLAEANRLLEASSADSIQLERPTPLSMQEPAMSYKANFRIQNTSLLTRATDFFAGAIKTSPAALSFLARLGIPLHSIENRKIGFVKGWGLADYLAQTDTTSAEIEQSPLFGVTENGKVTERFRAAFTIPDLDIISATRWILLMPPVCPEPGQPWPTRPPKPLHLRGQRPYLFGLASTPKRVPYLAVTDDPRIHLVMASENIPSCHTLNRNDPKKVAQFINRKEAKSISLLLHDRALAEGLADTLVSKQPGIKLNDMPPDQFVQLLEPATRDVTPIVGKRREPAAALEAAA